MGDFRVSWITKLYRPPLFELSSLASRFARAFYSLGTCTSSNVGKVSLRSVTHLKYEAICGFFAWYSPMTCPVTNNESLFTNKLRAPNSLASSIPATKASYSAWLLLALKVNLRACLINSLLGPSRIIPTPLPC